MNWIKLLKGMKDMGISAMSDGGQTTNIDLEYDFTRILTEIYLNEAVQAYNMLEYYEKAGELKNRLEVFVDEFPLDKENEKSLKSKISFSK